MNQRFLIKIACCNSIITCIFCITSTSTNNWLYTTEVLRYYIHPNDTVANTNDDILNQITYFKNATLGPWLFCWLDPATDFHCTTVNYFTTEEPYDVTTSVEFSVHRAFIFMISGTVLIILGLINAIICLFQKWPYHSLMCCAILHIFSGMANFACIIVYMAAVSKEISFLGNEFAALFSLLVYMAKRDERIFNKYHIRSLVAKMDENDFLNRCHCRHHMKHHRNRSIRSASEFLNNEYTSVRKSIAIIDLSEEKNAYNSRFGSQYFSQLNK
ncbi:Voltage-dependent calcium channel gamma-3 subunit [Dirofilaria immitis]